VIADRFERDFYGEMSDAVNTGERTDRFTVRWNLEREPGPRELESSEVVLANEGGSPGALRGPSGRSSLIEVPREYAELAARDPDLARSWRDASAEAIEACLSAGMVGAGFEASRSAYVFVAYEDVAS
jgi:predicted GNAT superfamily acetyltransferase